MTVELETSYWDEPFDMDMSEVVPAEGPLFPALEVGVPLSSKVAGDEADFSFLDSAMNEDAPGSLLQQVPVLLERRTWSSLAVVLLLHATLAWFLPISAKPPAQSPKIIEAQLVLLPGGSGEAGGAVRAGRRRGRRKKRLSCSSCRPGAKGAS